MKILIEVSEGIVVNVATSEIAEVYIIDHENAKYGENILQSFKTSIDDVENIKSELLKEHKK